LSINIEKKSESSDGYNVTCRFCGRKFLKWIHSDHTPSGWELQEKDGRTHNCYSNPKISEYDRLLNHFFENEVTWENDTPEVKAKKKEYTDKLRGVDESGLSYVERYFRDIDPELLKKYKKELEDWKK